MMRKPTPGYIASIKARGASAVMRRAFHLVSYRRSFLSKPGRAAVFTHIYRQNKWGSNESVSGAGSTLEYTQNLRGQLPALLAKYSVEKLFDAPCGDFHWMKLVVLNENISYVGGDIVGPLVQRNSSLYGNDRTTFLHLDLVMDTFPSADLMISRDCLFHLSNDDIRSLISNFIASEIPYLLTTTHINTTGFANTDINSGEFRLLDLFSPPFSFPDSPLERIDDWVWPHPPREMCLWSRDQVEIALAKITLGPNN